MVLIQNEHFGYKNENHLLKKETPINLARKNKNTSIEVLVFVNQGAAS